MRRVSKGHGFFLSLIINMVIRPEWPILSIILYVLHKVFGISGWFALIPLAIWVIYPLILTLVLGWVNSCGTEPQPIVHENKNPYSNGSGVNRNMNTNNNEDLMCPCCKKYKFDEAGKFEICPICNWEDDPSQRKNPTMPGGANKLSLYQAIEEYKKKESGAI